MQGVADKSAEKETNVHTDILHIYKLMTLVQLAGNLKHATEAVQKTDMVTLQIETD